MRSSHEARDGADFALSASVKPLAEAAVRDAVRRDRIHHLPGIELHMQQKIAVMSNRGRRSYIRVCTGE